MKKTLIAVAALAATSAFAQATVYGRADVGYGSVTTTTAGVDTKTSGVMSKGSVSSFIGVKGAEDLGGGLKATYKFEGNMDPATGNYPAAGSKVNTGFEFDRYSLVGLEGGFGSIAFGRSYTPLFSLVAANDAFGLSTFTPVNLSTVAGVSTGPQQIIYNSPNFNGLTLDVSLENNENGTKTTGNTIVVKYANGPLSVGFGTGSHQTETPPAAAVKKEGTVLVASYDFKVAKVMAMMQTAKDQGAAVNTDNKETNIQVTAPMGKATLKLGIGNNDNGVNTGSDLVIGADYALSKATALYAVTGTWNKLGDNKSTGTAIGIKTVF